jgi:hypothetical protein
MRAMLEGLARSLGCLALVTVLSGSARALAQAPAALSWVRETGAEACISAPLLGARVERLVGPVLVPAPAASVSVEGVIVRRGQRYAARIVVSEAGGRVLGERDVLGVEAAAGEEPDCRKLDDQLAFVIAVAIDPNAALAELPGDLAPEGDPGAELLADLKANPPRPTPSKTRSAAQDMPPNAGASEPEERVARWHVVSALGGGLGLGMLPSTHAAAVLELGAGLAWFTQRAHVALAPSQSVAAQSASVELSWLELGATSCAEVLAGSGLALELCAGVVVGHFVATPYGLAGDVRRRWLVGPRAAVRLTQALIGPLALGLEASALSVWPKHRVGYHGAAALEEVYEVPAIAGAARLFLELRFSL